MGISEGTKAMGMGMGRSNGSGTMGYADADMGGKKKAPALAIMFGHGEPDGDEGPGEEEEGGDEAALHKAGSAAMKAYAEGDPVAFAKAVAACSKIQGDGEDEYADADYGGEESGSDHEEYEDADMAKRGKLGSGKRFEAVEKSAAASGARDPGAVAAAMGRAAHGQKQMTRYSKMGR